MRRYIRRISYGESKEMAMPMSASEHEGQDEVTQAVQDNLEKIARISQREEEKVSVLQRVIEKICFIFGHPLYFAVFLVFCVAWVLTDLSVRYYTGSYFDDPPFFWLQGVASLNSVFITMAVLIRQNRLARIEEKRTHLELQVNLLAEQKATKIIQLLEELRRDMPNIKKRYDPHARTLQETTDPEAVLNALEEHRNKKDVA
jgi:uncharacterized membrane protein